MAFAPCKEPRTITFPASDGPESARAHVSYLHPRFAQAPACTVTESVTFRNIAPELEILRRISTNFPALYPLPTAREIIGERGKESGLYKMENSVNLV